MGSLKLQSFDDFANATAKAAKLKLEEEQSAARDAAAYEFKTLLSKFGVTKIKDLNEEDRNKFFRKLGATEISESVAIIEEGTRSQIGLINKRGKIKSVYMHYDGYPDHMLPTIKKGKYDAGTVKTLLGKGGGSYLEPDWRNINFYGDKTTLDGDVNKINKFIRDASNVAGAEFVYLFDERDGKWYMADVYAETGLQKAFESMVINEAFTPSKGNLRDAKKVKKALEQFFTNHNALMDKSIFLGVCKYLLAESLTDANFHSYREPVSKVLKGKLSTVFVEIDGLNNMKVPVGKKSIVNLLDEVGPFMASAAGWSGIGIVEGMALFLDSFGESNIAQAIVDAFNLIWTNESVMNEGNAFLAARAKAIEEDAEEFEFNGKKFPVIKEEVEESHHNEETKDLNEGVHAKIKKAIKAVEKGETVYGENIRFPGRFKILSFNKAGNMATVDYEDGTDAFDMAAMNIAIDKLQFEAVEVEEAEEAEEVTEAKFVKDFDKEVLDAETKADITTYYPSAKFFIGKMTHFFGELEPNLFFKAYYAKYYKEDTGKKIDGDFKITSIYSEKGRNYVHLYNESAQPTNEAEVKSDEEFKEYAFTVLGKAFGDKFDEEKAQEVVDGLLSKHGDDYGAAVGALTASLG
jgi:hypothetical protein